MCHKVDNNYVVACEQCEVLFFNFFFQLMVRGVEEKLILKGVLPQLTKLARDSEM